MAVSPPRSQNRVLPTTRTRGSAGVAQRKRRLARSFGLCEGEHGDAIVFADVVDHIIPLALGGSDDDSNTRNYCHACHAKATAEQFGHARVKRGCGVDGWPTDG